MDHNPAMPLPTGSVPVEDGSPNYYDLLDITPDASPDDITMAYQQQCKRYDPVQAAALGTEFATLAAERRAALDDAFDVLGDPQRRFAYDRQIGLVGDPAADRRGISNREITFAVGGILIGLLILAGIWSFLGRSAPTGPAVTEVNFPAPSFALKTLDGGNFDLSAYRGKVVLVNFWGTWCEPCKQEIPALTTAHSQLAADGLVIVGVDLLDAERAQGHDVQDVHQFVNTYGASYPIALDESGNVARDYKLYPIPVSYFIDRSGNVRFIRIGGMSVADVEALFRRL